MIKNKNVDIILEILGLRQCCRKILAFLCYFHFSFFDILRTATAQTCSQGNNLSHII